MFAPLHKAHQPSPPSCASGFLSRVFVEKERHIVFFGFFCTKHLMKHDYRDKYVNVILVMTLQIHEQCFEVCASNCSFKWNGSRAVGKEFNVLLNVNKKIRCRFWLEMIWRTFHITWLYRDMRNICYWSIWIEVADWLCCRLCSRCIYLWPPYCYILPYLLCLPSWTSAC